MLACLPGPAELSLQVLPHTQMNTGPHKWDTTQRMRSAQFPTPAELDAYAKKVAHAPLTIKIFPNSVKVPQRNHVRRTVNGLDTAGPRYSPYPPTQAGARPGLLAVVRSPPAAAKGVLKDFDGSRARSHPEAAGADPPGGPYHAAPSSTLNHHPQHHPLGLARPPQGLPPPRQTLDTLQSLPSLGLGHSQPPQGPPGPQAEPSGLLHPQPPQGPPRPQAEPSGLLHPQPPPGPPAVRKPPEGEAPPPNVTVSTSTIPMSMAAGRLPGPRADLGAIVQQINRFCHAARTHGATVCEGQIANPGPISRHLLIDACSRVPAHGYPPPSCVAPPPEKPHPQGVATAAAYHARLKPHPDLQLHLQQQTQQTLQHHNHKLRSWNPQHQVAHLQNGASQPAYPCKDLGYPHPEVCVGYPHPEVCVGYPHPEVCVGYSHPEVCVGYSHPEVCVGYPHPEVCVGQPYSLKPPIERPTPSPPVLYNNNNNNNGGGGMPCHMTHYGHAHYFQPSMWNSSILPTPNSDSSGSQDLGVPYHGAVPPGGAPPSSSSSSSSAPPGPPTAQTHLMHTADYLGGDFQTPYFRDHNLGLMATMQRPPGARAGGPDGGDGCSTLLQHPGYR